VARWPSVTLSTIRRTGLPPAGTRRGLAMPVGRSSSAQTGDAAQSERSPTVAVRERGRQAQDEPAHHGQGQ
jgi:hypothetical protein